MNDFLTRLAQLSTGEAAMVGPRLPGRFDQAPDHGFVEVTESGSGDNPAQRTARGRTAGPSAPMKARKPASPDSFSELPVKQSAAAEQQQQKPGLPSVPPDSAEENMADDQLLLVPAPDSSGKSRQQTPSRLAHSEPADGAGEPGPRQPVLAKIESASPDDGEDTIDGNENATETSLPSSPALLVQPGKDRPDEPAQASLQAPVHLREAKGEQTSVHINIGRVEVRANAAAAKPVPRVSSARPERSQSLQDYLQSGRSKAGRS